MGGGRGGRDEKDGKGSKGERGSIDHGRIWAGWFASLGVAAWVRLPECCEQKGTKGLWKDPSI